MVGVANSNDDINDNISDNINDDVKDNANDILSWMEDH